jgi:hypothetical protein
MTSISCPVEILLAEGDQLAVVGLVALDDVGVLDLLAVDRARALVLDPSTVGRVHLVEPDVVVGRGRVRLDRHADQTERDGAAPHRAHAGPCSLRRQPSRQYV